MKKDKYSNLVVILIFVWILTTLSGTWTVLQAQKEVTGYSSAVVNVDVVFINSTLFTEHDKYSPGVNVTIKGYNFTPNGMVQLDIINTTGTVSSLYPINLSLDQYGNFIAVWDTINVNYDNCTIIAEDLNYSARDKNKTVEILPPFNWIGRVIDPENESVPSIVLVYDEYGNVLFNVTEEYNLSFKYGLYHNISIFPYNISSVESVVINWMANEGPLGDSLEIDDTPETASEYTEFKELIAVYPLLQSYKYTTIIVNHLPSEEYSVFKCINWQDKARYCPNEDWENIQDIPNGITKTTIVIEPGDPGIGIGPPPVCGDGFCSVDENYITCPADCPAVPVVPRPVGGIPSSTVCVEKWNCTDWGPCMPNGIQYRDCWDLNKCSELYNEIIEAEKPETERECEYIAAVVEMPEPIRPTLLEAIAELPAMVINLIILIAMLAVLLIIIIILYLLSKKKLRRKRKSSK
jgi:hypothetical protein